MKAILLGCGEIGEEALKDLYEFGQFDELIVGTRTISKARLVVDSLKPNRTKRSFRKIENLYIRLQYAWLFNR